MANLIDIIECPRDAMQGWPKQIPTEIKIAYINQLLQVGFHTIDFGSFVSAKAIPQMADTAEVLNGLDLSSTKSKLLAIVANVRGAETAMQLKEIDYLGMPFSISPTFQMRNTNSSIDDALQTVATMQRLCVASNKQLVVYLSMAFGNPYNDAYSENILLNYAKQMADIGVQIISLADTVGMANETQITDALQALIPNYKDVQFGVHLHTSPTNYFEKLNAALNAGCTRIDGAINGIGGCPMANDELVGNLDTIKLIALMGERKIKHGLHTAALEKSMLMAQKIFV